MLPKFTTYASLATGCVTGVAVRKTILVELDPFRIQVSEYDSVVKTISSFSVGREGHRTPLFEGGALSGTKRERDHVSSIYPPPRGGARMPWALFFEQPPACAFHQGDPAVASHGCIHLVERDARWLFDWAGADPVALTVRGPYPGSPVAPQKLYAMGAPNMVRATVESIQQALANVGLYPAKVDGDFQVGTDEAVRAFQRSNGLVEDGKVGQNTAKALGIAW